MQSKAVWQSDYSISKHLNWCDIQNGCHDSHGWFSQGWRRGKFKLCEWWKQLLASSSIQFCKEKTGIRKALHSQAETPKRMTHVIKGITLSAHKTDTAFAEKKKRYIWKELPSGVCFNLLLKDSRKFSSDSKEYCALRSIAFIAPP